MIENRCLELFARDYKYSVIQNSNGEVCGHYPRQIVFLEYECTDIEKDRYLSTSQPKSMSVSYLFVCVAPYIDAGSKGQRVHWPSSSR